MKRFEIVIVGGGMAGLTLASALDPSSFQYCNVSVIDPAPEPANSAPSSPSFDDRSTALSDYTVQALERLGVQSLPFVATAIDSIEVSDQGHLGYHLMQAEQNRTFGRVISNQQLGALLWQRANQNPVQFRYSDAVARLLPEANGYSLTLASGVQIHADLVLICEGGRSNLIEQLGFQQKFRDFNAYARVASVKTQIHHGGRAFERFTANGPIALLPFGDFSALVWTLPKPHYEHINNLDHQGLLRLLNQVFGQRLGQITDISSWQDYPLAERQLATLAGHHVLALGNTAAMLHPVAGQGFNLAIRGIMRAAQCINQCLQHHQKLPSFQQLNSLSQTILSDQSTTVASSGALIDVFSSSHSAVQLARGLSLNLLDRHASASRLFSLAGMGWLQHAPLPASQP